MVPPHPLGEICRVPHCLHPSVHQEDIAFDVRCPRVIYNSCPMTRRLITHETVIDRYSNSVGMAANLKVNLRSGDVRKVMVRGFRHALRVGFVRVNWGILGVRDGDSRWDWGISAISVVGTLSGYDVWGHLLHVL